MWLARLRSYITRHRVVYWTVVVAAAVTIGAVLVEQSRRLERDRASWGETLEVWVAAADTAPGARLVVEPRSVPRAVVPRHAVRGPAPTDAVARQSISAGEVVVTGDVGTGRLALLTDPLRAVAVPADDSTLAVVAGDRVDVVAAGRVLATGGVVIEVRGGSVTVGVTSPEAPAVAAAAAEGVAVLILHPG